VFERLRRLLFEDLAAAHPAVTILDGDREWATYRIDSADPEALIAELWSQAHRPVPQHIGER
jgi:hypothetical protein